MTAGFRQLTGAQRFLLASSFAIPLGSFAVLPFMSVLLHQRLGIGLGTVGIVLAVASLVQLSGGIAGAAVAERIGLQRSMLLALVIRTIGFGCFIPGLRWPGVAVAALVLTCCGAALYLPANKAYLVQDADQGRRPLLLSASSSALNAGIALGPVAAGPFVLTASTALFVVITLLFTAVTIGHALLPRETSKPLADGRPHHVLAGIAVLPFAATVLSLYLFMFFQHYLAVYAVPRTSAPFYGLVLGTYALVLVLVQPLVAGWIGRLPYPRALLVGFAAMAAGFAAIALGTAGALLVGALLICIGEIVLFLRNDLEALARSTRSPAVVFGQQRLAAGIGAFTSGVLGGQGYHLAERSAGAAWFWIAIAVQCAVLPLLIPLASHRARRAACRTH